MHLLALSGLHVGIIYKLVELMLFFIGGSVVAKRLKSLIIVLLLWGFAITTGLSSSIFRAVLMITIHELSGWRYSDRDGLTSLAASALIITIFNPEAPGGGISAFILCRILDFYHLSDDKKIDAHPHPTFGETLEHHQYKYQLPDDHRNHSLFIFRKFSHIFYHYQYFGNTAYRGLALSDSLRANYREDTLRRNFCRFTLAVYREIIE